MRDLRLIMACLCAAAGGVAELPAQTLADTVVLPRPTGPHPVGTVVWHWADARRLDLLTPEPADVREVMVQAWYPTAADAASARAPYAPLVPTLGRVRSWSVPETPVSALAGRLAVVLIAPGRGVARHYYTGVAEDLASHGYLVVAVDSPHSGRVVYPSGRVVPPNPKYAIPFEVLTGPYERVDVFFTEAAELGAGDIDFVLSRLADIDRDDPARRFTGRMDLSRLGAFGHSLGGRIAGAAVGLDRRFVAYASMEGVPPRSVRRTGMDAAVMMMVSSELPDMAQPNIREVIPNRRADVYVATLRGFGHNSVTDLPLLDPVEYAYDVDPSVGLETVRELLRLFFDHHLLGRGWPLDASTLSDLVTLEVFERR